MVGTDSPEVLSAFMLNSLAVRYSGPLCLEAGFKEETAVGSK